MAATALGTAVTFGVGGTMILYAADGTTAVNTGPLAVGAIQSGEVTHNDDSIVSKDSVGVAISHTVAGNDNLELSITAILSASTKLNAALSGSLPLGNGRCVITGCPIIKMGPWADAINTNTAGAPNTYLWIYAGGGKVSLQNDGTASFSATFKRFRSIDSSASAAAVTV